ncbi:alpha-amylase family glycosyl hydrolase [Alteromonas halophila]|uniref:Cyclomaltodextrin glucanotransferase n=1 Tax=Alteromonas halophila TaxID=516698 RepID=A0A918MZ75_9ALTE|nr:alpha-amylase family glycosyl hydrolase [Alteromonas halophila]GGW88174.1 cyclomaltodextrin glucanotransferase [Alteromonas halophila]
MRYGTRNVAMLATLSMLAAGCVTPENGPESAAKKGAETHQRQHYFGTREPFASEAVYFVMTDRFVDGDPSNNHEDQGGEHPTWQLPLKGPDGERAYVGYMGGDLRGVLNNADYIKDMGFTAVWLTPLVANPDQAFTGDEPITYGGAFKDGGKTGYHGYWATNFYKPDEHFISDDLTVKQYTQAMREMGFKNVFDIVANHGTPSFTMPDDQPGFGEIYDREGKLVADHENLHPSELDPENNPLHAFFHDYPDLVKLSNLDDTSPAVRDYLINSYLYWIEQGADAFRIDTIRHVPHSFWREMSERVRAAHPGFYMFGESFEYDANAIAQHTLEKNGAISVLDFPMQKAMLSVFEKPAESDFADLAPTLHLQHGPYRNPYDLTIFYDNHDMARMNATDNGFINAHNWLFTVRGIPVVYQGSEIGFMRGTAEHAGNRNYFGQHNIDKAPDNAIHNALRDIAQIRKQTPALQRGLQVNVRLKDHQAVFYRVLQDNKQAQTALVLLNKGPQTQAFEVSEYIQGGTWQEQLSGQTRTLRNGESLVTDVAANGVQVWVRNGEVRHPALVQQMNEQMATQ